MLENYFYWHYARAPVRIIQIVGGYLRFFTHFFSVRLLVKSLFSPWKREIIQKEKPGLNLEEIVNVISYNLISRCLGTILRLSVLCLWLITEIAAFIGGSLLFLVWIVTPGLTFPLFITLAGQPDPGERILKKAAGKPTVVFLLTLETKMAKFVFKRLGISLEELKALALSSPAGEFIPEEKSLSGLLYSLAKNWPPFRDYLKNKDLEEKDILSCCQWFERIEQEKRERQRFWEEKNLLQNPGIGKDWAYGYTLTLNQFSSDLSQPLAYSHHLIGRQKVLAQFERVLGRTQENNLLLVGEPGVGKETIILNLARQVKEGKINPGLAHKRVLSLNLNQILAGTASPLEAKGKLEEVFKEAGSAGNIILTINQFDQFLGGPKSLLNLSDVFAKALRERKVQIIGVTTPDNFQKFILPNQEIMKYFEKVEAVAPTMAEALIILEDVAPVFEEKTKTFILYQSLMEALNKSDQYLANIPFPEKAIDLLDETCVHVANQNKGGLVTPNEIDFILAEKTKVPLGEIKKEELEKLKNLEEFLHQRVVDQQQAVSAIASAMRRRRLEISPKEKPIGSFLFLGPTGVGKTETAKALAACYFGSEKQIIRLDMSEYQGEVGLNKALGAPASEEPGIFGKKIRENPFAVLLLDEIEKTDSKILNLFLTMLDEGFFTDNFGKKIDCRHLIIIGTSNAGSEFIRERINQGVGEGQLSAEVLEFIQREKIFSPEFLNRFDEVVVYRPLSPVDLQKIARLLLTGLNQRLAEKDLSLKITDSLVAKIATLGYQPALGARPMRRVIQDKIEEQIAQKILKGEVQRGQQIELEI